MGNSLNSTIYKDTFWNEFDPLDKFWYNMMVTCYTIYFIIGVPASLAVMIYYVKYYKFKMPIIG